MPVLESKIERDTCARAAKLMGVIGTKLVAPGETGYPDRIFWLPVGRPLLIEFKRPGENARPKQVFIHEQLRGLGYEVQVHDNVNEALRAIRAALIQRGVKCEWNGE